MDLYEFDSQIKGGIWTRMELLANMVVDTGKQWASKTADQIYGEGKSVSAIGRFFGKGPPADDMRKFQLAYTSILIHEVVIRSAVFCPDDPEAFQDRFGAAVMKLVAPELRDNLSHAANKNIDAYRRRLNEEIDAGEYVAELCGRFLAHIDWSGYSMPPALAVATSYPPLIEFVNGMVEVIEES